MHVCKHVRIAVGMCARMYVRVCVCVCACMCACAHAFMCAYTNIARFREFARLRMRLAALSTAPAGSKGTFPVNVHASTHACMCVGMHVRT